MPPIHIRTYGDVPSREDIYSSLDSILGTKVQVKEGRPTDRPNDPDVVRCDLILAAPDLNDEAKARSCIRFLQKLIIRHGAWSYLPIVVFSPAAGTERAAEITQMGVSLILTGAEHPAQAASYIVQTLLAAWWSAEMKRDIPVFVLSSKGTIWRANVAASLQFGSDLVGRQFSQAVERRRDANLQENHPLKRASRDAQAVSEDLTIEGHGRFYAFATPIHTPRRGMGQSKNLPVALWLYEASHWPVLVKAANTFAMAPNQESLFWEIVNYARQLGFTRARLYERDGSNFRGRASVGFLKSEKEEWFKSWSIKISEDFTSKEMIDLGEQQARLWEPNCDPDLPSTDLIRRLTGPANFAEELEKEGVHRWIEAPIWLPVADGSPDRIWGKLSLDREDKSDTLNARDADKASELARVAGRAIATRLHLDQQAALRDHEDECAREFQQCGIELNRLLSGASASSIREEALALVLQTLLKIAGGEIALYREFHEESGTLRQIGGAIYADASWSERFKPPPTLRHEEFLLRYFRFFGSSPPRALEPFIENDPRPVLDGLLSLHTFPREEEAYLQAIESELHVPVFKGDKIRGAIFVVATLRNVFTDRDLEVIKRFLHVVSVWMELARHLDGQRWIDRTFHTTIPLLPKLAAVSPTDDEAFFAGLAALLSSGAGLGWNRVFVFSCHASVLPYTAELVYALGGLAGGVGADEHARLQDALAADKALQKLEDLVDARLRDPRPHYASGIEAGVLRDALYELCIETPRRNAKPLRVHYGPWSTSMSSANGDGATETVNPIRFLVGHDVEGIADFPTPTPFPFHNRHDQPNQWILDLIDNGFPGMFTKEPRRVDFFPLWSVLTGKPEPLGVVALDLQIPVNQSREDMLTATRVLLGLAADVFAARILARRLRGGVNSLQTVSHRRTLQDRWYGLCYALGVKRTDDTAADAASPSSGDKLGSFVVPESIGEVLGTTGSEVLGGLCAQIEAQINRLVGMNTGELETDLVAALELLQQLYPIRPKAGTVLQVSWETKLQGMRIPADKQVLRDTIICLLENSNEAILRMSEAAKPAQLVASLDARLVKPPNEVNRFAVIVLEYTDNGPGIDPQDRERIFLGGFTSSTEAGRKKGYGLTYLMTLLMANQGYISAVDPPNGSGACFRIHFCIEQGKSLS